MLSNVPCFIYTIVCCRKQPKVKSDVHVIPHVIFSVYFVTNMINKQLRLVINITLPGAGCVKLLIAFLITCSFVVKQSLSTKYVVLIVCRFHYSYLTFNLFFIHLATEPDK